MNHVSEVVVAFSSHYPFPVTKNRRVSQEISEEKCRNLLRKVRMLLIILPHHLCRVSLETISISQQVLFHPVPTEQSEYIEHDQENPVLPKSIKPHVQHLTTNTYILIFIE